ncbi:unnamed protein product [Owenia fusiformis]|uniref:Uncharacterized protein n=1 Tax=Owenia fusiformis TaxID=6347 RepID=A0A8S4Q3L2_OWEFU|nr:unnamed protein product [Owenia fusiformis]
MFNEKGVKSTHLPTLEHSATSEVTAACLYLFGPAIDGLVGRGYVDPLKKLASSVSTCVAMVMLFSSVIHVAMVTDQIEIPMISRMTPSTDIRRIISEVVRLH